MSAIVPDGDQIRWCSKCGRETIYATGLGVKCYAAARNRRPEVKAKVAAYRQRPEYKAKKAAYRHAQRIARLEAKLARLRAEAGL